MGNFKDTFSEFYSSVVKSNWSPITGGILIALFAILLEMWGRPWGIIAGLRNWGEWFWYWVGVIDEEPIHPLWSSASVINIGFLLGAFISANLAYEFGIRVPPFLEIIKGIIGGILMGIGGALARGCNIGGFYTPFTNLSASAIPMMIGLMIGALVGVKYLLWEIEHLPSKGGTEISLKKLNPILGIIALIVLIWGGYAYFHSEDEMGALLGGSLFFSAGIGYAMHRSRLCFVAAFREPFLSGEATFARAIILSMFLAMIGILFIKLAEIMPPMVYVPQTFIWGALIGGFIFGIGMVIAGGCGSGSLFRVAEGQVKLIIAVIFFALTNALVRYYMDYVWKIWDKGILGKKVFLPNYLGYGGAFILLSLVLLLWYVFVTWNEKSEKFVIGL